MTDSFSYCFGFLWLQVFAHDIILLSIMIFVLATEHEIIFIWLIQIFDWLKFCKWLWHKVLFLKIHHFSEKNFIIYFYNGQSIQKTLSVFITICKFWNLCWFKNFSASMFVPKTYLINYVFSAIESFNLNFLFRILSFHFFKVNKSKFKVTVGITFIAILIILIL